MKPVDKINKLIEKSETRKQKLVAKIERLHQEEKDLSNAKENDLQESILNDGQADKKISKDLKAVQDEIAEAQEELPKIDGMITSSIQSLKEEVTQERNQYISEAKESTFNPLYAEANDLKIAYLKKLIEISEKSSDFESNYRRRFHDIEDKVGLRRHDPRDDFKLSLNRRWQIKGQYTPVATPDELHDAVYENKISPITLQNKDTFK